MTKMIQIRDVPDDLHRRLEERAAKAGMPLSEYLPSKTNTSPTASAGGRSRSGCSTA